MKKLYALLMLTFLFGFFSQNTFAQLQANNDSVTVVNGSETTVVLQDVLANDVLNNVPVSLNNVTISSISSSSEFFDLLPNGSVLFSGGPAPMGTYTIGYMICTNTSPVNCSEATVFLNVGCAPIAPPVVLNVVQPSCLSGDGSITLGALTPGQIIEYTVNSGPLMTIVAVGNSVTIPVTDLGFSQYYSFQIVDGACTSPALTIPIGSLNGLEFIMESTYVDYNADGHTNVGDIIEYDFMITNNGCGPVQDIQVNSTIVNISGGPINFLGAGATDNTTFTGTYVLTQADINNGYVSKSASIMGTSDSGPVGNQASNTFTLDISDGIKLIAFIDTNSNGVKDPTEALFGNGTFNYEINNSGTVHHVSSSNNQGFYLFEGNPSNSYDLSYSIHPDFSAYYSTSNVYNDVTVAANSGITTYYFALTEIPYTDISVNLYGYGAPPRPGFSYANYLYVRNNGNQTVAAATVTFAKSDVVTITAISQTGTTPTANGFTYEFTNLLPGEYRMIIVDMLVPVIPIVSLGQSITNTASVTTPAGDIDLTNHNATLSQIIVGSYDPNDKTESHGGKVLFSTFTADDYLTYTIRFENTGTANAVNVRVTDVLDSQLDETSVRMVNASHAYTLDRVGSTLTWRFDAIELPPSVEDTMIGHGYITFQVKPKAGYALGDVIPNIASIYFDFNPPIVTEPCLTQFVNSLRTEKFAFENFNCYPNPVKSVVTVSNDTAIDKVVITSILGQTVIEKNVNALKSEIDLSGLASGVYFVKASSQKQSKTVKIIKE